MTLKITSPLKESAILTDFDGGYWNWNRRDTTIESEVASAHNVSRNAGKYVKNLFLGAEAPLVKVRTIIQSAREVSNGMTLPWAPSRRLLLNRAVLTYKQRMERARILLDDANRELASVWDSLVASAVSTLNTMSSIDDYPTSSEVVRANYIRYKFYPLADASDVRLKADADLVEEIKASVEADQAEVYATAVLSSWERLLDVISSATKNLGKNLSGKSSERYRSEWHENLATLIPLLSCLNVANDPRLDDMANRCKVLLRPDPEEYQVSLTARADAYRKATVLYDDLSSLFGTVKQEVS